jgi:hypothetical protein
MQTILKVVQDNRGQASMVDNYLAQFSAKAANEALSIESPSSDGDNVAFVRDDAYELRDNCAEQQRAHLGSFEHLPNQANNTAQFILINFNPIILLYRRNGQNLRLGVASASSGAAGNPESE